MPNVRSKGPVIGLTGGMGSGKSTVLAMFRKKGAFVLDADAIVKELLDKNKSVKDRIKKEFGPETVDAGGNVNKRTLARRVFSSARQRKKLERILHPLVRREIWSALRKHWGNRLAVVDIPLLYESGWQSKLDGVIVVDAGLDRRLKRLKKRGFSAAEARRRIQSQMSLAQKARRADFVIDNNRSIRETKKQVDSIWKQLPNMTLGGH